LSNLDILDKTLSNTHQTIKPKTTDMETEKRLQQQKQ